MQATLPAKVGRDRLVGRWSPAFIEGSFITLHIFQVSFLLCLPTGCRHWILALSHDPTLWDATFGWAAHDVGGLCGHVLPLLRSNTASARKLRAGCCPHSNLCLLHNCLHALASTDNSFCKLFGNTAKCLKSVCPRPRHVKLIIMRFSEIHSTDFTPSKSGLFQKVQFLASYFGQNVSGILSFCSDFMKCLKSR